MIKPSNIDSYDIQKLFEQHRQVAIIWCAEDVKQVRPDLTDDQAWEVLKLCDERHDCEIGFTWTFIELIAEEMYPSPHVTETHEKGA